jgi:hypothetical protein
MDTEYMINFSPFRVVADNSVFPASRSYIGHIANSFVAGIGMIEKQNAKFAYEKKFCVNPITYRKCPVEMPGTVGIIPLCATKDIKAGEEVIVKYCSGTSGYIINNILRKKRSPEAVHVQVSDSVHERNQRAYRRSGINLFA